MHDAGALDVVAVGDLDLAEAEGVFHHHPAALEAAILESLQGGGQRLLPLDLLGEDDGVFDSDAAPAPG